MSDPSVKQWDYLLDLKDRMKGHTGSDIEFYDIVERETGKRTTVGLSGRNVSRIITAAKEYLE